jgi:hypothetical protein
MLEHPAPGLRERSVVADGFKAADGGIQGGEVVSRRPALIRGAESIRHLLIDQRTRPDGPDILRGEMIGPGLYRLIDGRKADGAQGKKPIPVRLRVLRTHGTASLAVWAAGELHHPVIESTQVSISQRINLSTECFLASRGGHADKPIDHHSSPDPWTKIMLGFNTSLV